MSKKTKKFKVIVEMYCDADNVTQAGLKVCDAGLIAGCTVKSLTIKQTTITEVKNVD